MAAESPGDVDNAEFGFTPDDSSVVTFGGTNVGFIAGDVEMNVPREYSFLQLDQVRVDLSQVCIRKELMIGFGLDEPLLASLQYAWDNDAASGATPDVLTIDDDMGGTGALVVNTSPPNDTGNDTRVITASTAVAVGDATYTIGQSAKQTISGIQFKAIASSSQVLATVTDTYNA